MPHPVMGRNILPLGNRQRATGRQDPVFRQNHRPVVERRILEEDIFDQTPVDAGVHFIACENTARQLVHS